MYVFYLHQQPGIKLPDPHSQILSMQLKREQLIENPKRVLSFLTHHASAAATRSILDGGAELPGLVAISSPGGRGPS